MTYHFYLYLLDFPIFTEFAYFTAIKLGFYNFTAVNIATNFDFIATNLPILQQQKLVNWYVFTNLLSLQVVSHKGIFIPSVANVI